MVGDVKVFEDKQKNSDSIKPWLNPFVGSAYDHCRGKAL